MSEGFLGRWSRRKVEAQAGRAVEVEPAQSDAQSEIATPLPQRSAVGEGCVSSDPSSQDERSKGGAPEAKAAPPPLTLEDVKALTGDSDFTRFLAPQVAPEVRNAALKKLFSDPRFNVMDGMDVYVDDYTKPDPIPEAMMRKLTAHLVRSFEKPEQHPASATRDAADPTDVQSVAQSDDEATPAVPEPSVHDDPDLRLQQDDAAEGPEPGRDAG